tara:strand:+ start:244 stop:363 length:120 start_codon:yes stop_codon:yes gene_type:complete
MIKKIVLLVFIFFAVISCGKKGCPKYNEADKCSELFKQS